MLESIHWTLSMSVHVTHCVQFSGALLALPEAHISLQQTTGMLPFQASNGNNPEQPGHQATVVQPEHKESAATQSKLPPSELSDFLTGAWKISLSTRS